MTALVANRLTVHRQAQPILQDVSFAARGGDFVAVIGPNGAGKSTLLSVLAGLLRADTGFVTLDAAPLTSLTRRQLAHRRAYLPQNPHCEWPIAVERVVALGLIPILPAFGELPDPLLSRIDSVLASCDLLAKRSQPVTTLSGGELARTMLARALVGDPDILIVDEPTAGLDPRHALEAASRLRALARTGKLVIAALHDLNLVTRYASRVLALEHGRIAADGPIESVLTPQLLRTLFEVEAHVGSTPGGTFIQYLPIDHAAEAPAECASSRPSQETSRSV